MTKASRQSLRKDVMTLILKSIVYDLAYSLTGKPLIAGKEMKNHE
jgi:hypothetical protein